MAGDLMEIPQGSDWREKMTPDQRRLLGVELPTDLTSEERLRRLQAKLDAISVGDHRKSPLTYYWDWRRSDDLNRHRDLGDILRDLRTKDPGWGTLEARKALARTISLDCIEPYALRMRPSMKRPQKNRWSGSENTTGDF